MTKILIIALFFVFIVIFLWPIIEILISIETNCEDCPIPNHNGHTFAFASRGYFALSKKVRENICPYFHSLEHKNVGENINT
jgi:hypothetical protein